VLTRTSADEPLSKLTWDLEHVERQNEWEMLREPVSQDEAEAFEELCGDHGTLVIWSKCDRILSKEYEPGSAQEQSALKRLATSLQEHISLIYYRFLDAGDTRERTVSIVVNGTAVEPWNPFFTEKSEAVLTPEQQEIEIELEDGSVEKARMQAWLLPHARDISKAEQSKARIANHRQGFYIHREGRVIQSGGWLGVFGREEPHYSLLRVEFDFGYELDDAFKVDVKKSRILFDPALEEYLREALQPIYREANNRYRRRERDANVEKGIDHSSANKSIGSTPTTKKATVTSVDPVTHTPVIANNRGLRIKLKQPVQSNVSADSLYVEAVENITSGELWQPVLRSSSDDGFSSGVLLNKHHDFYQKIYKRAVGNGYAVEGMDLLLWAFAAAEQNNTNPELEPIFEDFREEISANLRKLLRDVPEPDPDEIS
jgi:hypothetical protein